MLISDHLPQPGSGNKVSEHKKTSINYVRDLMTVGVETCSPATPVIEVARLMLENGWEDVVVLEEGNAVGVISQVELVKAFTRPEFADLCAEDILREDVPQVPPDIPLEAAAQFMLDKGVRTLFLMHHAGGIEYPAALISFRHLLRFMVAQDPSELSDLGLKAERESPLETFIRRRNAARRRYNDE